MRHFIVLGFTSTSNLEQGEPLHVGSDRGEALGATNTPTDGFVRKEMFELARPHKSCHFEPKKATPKKATPKTEKKA